MIKIKPEPFQKETVMMREVLAKTLMGLAEKDSRIVAMDADLASSSGMKSFAKAYPDRFFNCGIAEANMIGVAAGLSSMGKVPFVHSFGCFASRRVADQVFISACYAKANIRIIGSDPGVTAAYNGGTHMPFEDMAMLRAIPHITLIEPTDSVMLADLLPKLVEAEGVFYIRLPRKQCPGVYQDGSSFEIGKGVKLRDGSDVTIVASGFLAAEAMEAARILDTELNIHARVCNLFTWKPVDAELLEESAAATGAIVTCENHNIMGGLGSAVCEAVAATKPVPVVRLGVDEEFGEVGTEDYLKRRFRMTALDIVAKSKEAVALKKNQ